jgi:hypothetical protein
LLLVVRERVVEQGNDGVGLGTATGVLLDRQQEAAVCWSRTVVKEENGNYRLISGQAGNRADIPRDVAGGGEAERL